jgi:hypothetical protein
MPKALILLFVLVVAALGQTSADLSLRYRQLTSYELRPDIIMTPKFSSNGQVCEMGIERRQKTETSVIFNASFSEEEVQQLMDELAPKDERGRNLTKHLNSSVVDDFIRTDYDYENINVRVYGITRPAPGGDKVIVITWTKRACGAVQAAAR